MHAVSIRMRYQRYWMIFLYTIQFLEIFCMNSRAKDYAGKRVRKMGESVWDVARNLFSSLRQADSQGVEVILFEDVGEEGMGLAVSNRIIRAAGFDILSV